VNVNVSSLFYTFFGTGILTGRVPSSSLFPFMFLKVHIHIWKWQFSVWSSPLFTASQLKPLRATALCFCSIVDGDDVSVL
jgi:hypothetical protein